MKEIIYYEAFDGEIFERKQQCEEYEDRFRRISDYIRFYDADMNEISINPIDDEGSVMDAYNGAMYIEILPAHRYKAMAHFFADIYYGMYIGNCETGYEAGLYKYDEAHGDFVKVDNTVRSNK